MGAAVGSYGALFAACGMRPQHDILLPITNRRLYIGPHAQEYSVNLDTEREELLTRLTLEVRNLLEGGFALSLFLVEAAPSPRGSEPTLVRDPMMRVQLEQEITASGTTECHQNAGNRDTPAAEQPGTARTRFEAASTIPGETGPSNDGSGGSGGRNG